MSIWLIVAAGAVLACIAAVAGAMLAMRQTVKETSGNAYYGLSRAGREAAKQRIRRRGRLFLPVFRVLARKQSPLRSAEFEGVAMPAMVGSVETLAAAAAYRPDLGDSGHGHLYAASPWIEATSSVSMST